LNHVGAGTRTSTASMSKSANCESGKEQWMPARSLAQARQ
jgi:hypothetical protein